MRQILCLITILVLMTSNCLAGDTETAAPWTPKAEGHVLLDDAKGMLLAPGHWKRAQWLRAGEAAALVGTLYLGDKTIASAVQRNRSQTTDDFSKAITPFGGHRALQASVIMIGSGFLSHDTTLRDAGLDSLEAELWAAGLVTPVIKRVAGRARPIQEEGASSFHPFSSNHASFPSGHATNAFAFATAVAAHYDGWVVPTIVYSIATGVAFARVNDRAHFPSDVLAGALIGHAVARSVVYRHRSGTRLALGIAPFFGERFGGVMFTVRKR